MEGFNIRYISTRRARSGIRLDFLFWHQRMNHRAARLIRLCYIPLHEHCSQNRNRRWPIGHFEATDRGYLHYLEKRV
jgi:hypothetical protein